MYTNNPYTVYNGMISNIRNIVILITLGIGITMSNNILTEIYKIILSIIILGIAIYIGKSCSIDFKNYILYNKKLPSYINTNNWKSYIYITYILIFLSLVLMIIQFNNLIKYYKNYIY